MSVSRRRYDGEQKTENRKFEKIRERKQSDFLLDFLTPPVL